MVFTIVRLVIDWIIDAYITVLFVRMILDWVSVLAPRWYPKGVVASLINVVYQLTEPPLRWLRRYIRPIPMGPIAMDVSFIVLYTALVALENIGVNRAVITHTVRVLSGFVLASEGDTNTARHRAQSEV